MLHHHRSWQLLVAWCLLHIPLAALLRVQMLATFSRDEGLWLSRRVVTFHHRICNFSAIVVDLIQNVLRERVIGLLTCLADLLRVVLASKHWLQSYGFARCHGWTDLTHAESLLGAMVNVGRQSCLERLGRFVHSLQGHLSRKDSHRSIHDAQVLDRVGLAAVSWIEHLVCGSLRADA